MTTDPMIRSTAKVTNLDVEARVKQISDSDGRTFNVTISYTYLVEGDYGLSGGNALELAMGGEQR